jgi:hypothetical protein
VDSAGVLEVELKLGEDVGLGRHARDLLENYFPKGQRNVTGVAPCTMQT